MCCPQLYAHVLSRQPFDWQRSLFALILALIIPVDTLIFMLLVENVSRSFGSRRVLGPIDFTLGPGVKALLGPNGSGKSTFMKLAAGALSPSSGTISFMGFKHDPKLELKKLTGFVPDVGGLFPRLSAFEHLELNARLRNISSWEARAATLLETLDLARYSSMPVSTFSHGMSRKLSAAIAFQGDPKLVLLDEPFDGVDPLGVDALESLIREVSSRGGLALVSTHLLDVAERLCDEVLVLSSGTLLAQGSFEDVANSLGCANFPEAYRKLVS